MMVPVVPVNAAVTASPVVVAETDVGVASVASMPALATALFMLIQSFSQKSLTATVPKVFQIGLCGVVEADLELFCNSWSMGFSGERL